MLRKPVALILSLALMFSLFASCTKDEADVEDSISEETYSFIDGAGKTVEVKIKPQRVAVLFSSFADIWKLAGGKTDITVGEAVERGFADSSAVLVDASAGKTINTETLLASNPDFVICSADIQAQAECAELLYNAGIPCAQMKVESFEDYLNVLKIFTDITQDGEAYKKYGTQVGEKIAALLEKIPTDGERKRILFIRSGSSASSAKAKTASEHFAAAMLEQLGVYNIADNAPVLLDGLSIEEIMKEDPDEIFISTMGDEEAAKAYMTSVIESEAWQSLTAVKEGKYIYLPKELFQFKPNAQWYEAYLYLAEILYPEIELK